VAQGQQATGTVSSSSSEHRSPVGLTCVPRGGGEKHGVEWLKANRPQLCRNCVSSLACAVHPFFWVELVVPARPSTPLPPCADYMIVQGNYSKPQKATWHCPFRIAPHVLLSHMQLTSLFGQAWSP
jgi:hypothetical protein